MNTQVVLAVIFGSSAVLGGFHRAEAQTPVRTQMSTLDSSADQTLLASRNSASRRGILDKPITIALRSVSAREAVQKIAALANVSIQYQDVLLDRVQRPVTVVATQRSVESILNDVLAGTDLRVVASARNVLTIQATGSITWQDQGTITGKVIHASTKQPIPGATITVAAGTQNTMTKADGTFRLELALGEHTLLVRALGFERRTTKAMVSSGATTTLEIVLAPSASVLDEVVVTGTVAATERRAVTTPVTVITSEDIEKRGVTRIEQLLHGEVPGVFAMDLGVAAYRPTLGQSVSATVYSRGSSSLDGGPTPMKTFIDGVELLDPSYLGTIDPQSIERIEIITDPQAATVYGAGALGGVMQIFTKRGTGQSRQEYIVNLRYGMLQSNLSAGRTPTHTHSVSMNGGAGAAFSYSANLSYNYTGQWQPKIFTQRTGAQLGVRHSNGPLELNASASFTYGRSGTTQVGGWGIGAGSPYEIRMLQSGEWWSSNMGGFMANAVNNRKSTSQARTLAFTASYRVNQMWMNEFTIGQSDNTTALEPVTPGFYAPVDSLFSYNQSGGQRLTVSYSSTIHPPALGFIAPMIVIGGNGSSSKSSALSGRGVSKEATSLQTPSVTLNPSISTWGAFINTRLSLFGQVYANVGLRADKNSSYGKNVNVKLTPTNGLTWTYDYGDVSVKLLGSYGKATRAPTSDMRLGVEAIPYAGLPLDDMYPNFIYTRLESLELTAETEAGSQGGVEIYWGNRGYVMFNAFRQRVTDLIQLFPDADSVLIERPISGASPLWRFQSQYRNVGSIDKQGWDATVSANLWMLTVKGVLSWADSRVRYARPGSGYVTGEQIRADNVPSHSGNISVSYASGGTSVMLISDIKGASTTSRHHELSNQMRIRTYANSVLLSTQYHFRQEGYVKSNLIASQRLSRSATASLNITNLGNSFESDMQFVYPSLGRQTQLGMSFRF